MATPATTLAAYQDQLQRITRMFAALPGVTVSDYGDSAGYYLHIETHDQQGYLLSYNWQAGDTHWHLAALTPDGQLHSASIDVAVTAPADRVARTAWQAIQPVLPDLRDVFSRALSVIEESDDADAHASLIEEMRLLLVKGRVR